MSCTTGIVKGAVTGGACLHPKPLSHADGFDHAGLPMPCKLPGVCVEMGELSVSMYFDRPPPVTGRAACLTVGSSLQLEAAY